MRSVAGSRQVVAHATSYRGDDGADSGENATGEGGAGMSAPLALERVFFGISQTVSAPAISVSAVTVDDALCLTVQYATPIWPEAAAEAFADDFARVLELAAREG